MWAQDPQEVANTPPTWDCPGPPAQLPSSLDLALQHLLSAPDPEEPLNKHVLQHQLGLTVILFYLLCRQNTVETPVGVKTGEVS